MVRPVINHHSPGTLEKVIETAYRGMPDMTNDALSVTYLGNSTDPHIVSIDGIIVQPTPTGPALMELYKKYSKECPVHQTLIVTTDTYYTATYIKEN